MSWERLQQQAIIGPLGVNETSEWCNSFVLVTRDNGKVRLCLDPASAKPGINKAHTQGAHTK